MILPVHHCVNIVVLTCEMEAIFLFLISLYEIQITKQYEIDCPPLPIIEFPNGKIRVYRDRIYFSCDEDYRLFGPNYLRCSEGNWSSEIIPRCRLPYNRCEQPDPIEHGSIWGESNIGDEIAYFCDSGYRLLGNRNRKCLSSRRWSGIDPICQDENESLTKIAERMKKQFITKVGEYSSDSTSRAIGTEIKNIGLEMIFLIDRSSSIDPIDFKKGIEFAKFLIDEFGVANGINNNVGTRVAFVTFGDTAEIEVNVNDDKVKNKEDAKSILDSLMAEGGGTAMTLALNTIPGKIYPLLRSKAKRVIFLLTDGHNNVGTDPPGIIANELKQIFNFEIFAVGIGQDINKNELIEIASSPQKNHVFLLKQYSDLNDILWSIRNNKETIVKEANCGFLPKTKDKKELGAVKNWPWLATIYVLFHTNSEQPKLGICSGSLICPRWILTSASCFYGEDKKNSNRSTSKVFVTMGDKNIALFEKTEMNYYAVKVRFHPKYNRAIGGSHDLALLKVNEDVPINDLYKPICIPQTDFLFNENRRAIMVGWGNVPSDTYFEKYFASSFRMLPNEINMPIARDFECRRVKITITDDLFCAGSITNRTCAGNLGSPLVMIDKDTNLRYLIGVLVEREWCNTQFNVFVHVQKHINWINNITNFCSNNEALKV